MTLPLPDVPISVNCGPGLACTTRTRSYSAPSSSAMIIGSEVETPCPISDLSSTSVTTPSLPISIHWLAVSGGPLAAARQDSCGIVTISAMPCSVASLRNSRRVAGIDHSE